MAGGWGLKQGRGASIKGELAAPGHLAPAGSLFQRMRTTSLRNDHCEEPATVQSYPTNGFFGFPVPQDGQDECAQLAGWHPSVLVPFLGSPLESGSSSKLQGLGHAAQPGSTATPG